MFLRNGSAFRGIQNRVAPAGARGFTARFDSAGQEAYEAVFNRNYASGSSNFRLFE